VETIRNPENEGFGRAINRAAALTSSEALVLLNDDCVCDPGFAASIVGALDPARGVVMAAGVLRSAGPSSVIDTAGIELDATLLAFDYLNGEPLSALEGVLADPVGPCAAAAAYDRESFIDVGGFDEALFAYWEDVDLALRLRVAGGLCALVRSAQGVHAHSATLGPGSARKDYLMGFGRGYVLRKWGALTPRRLPLILARDLPICLGQLAFDRTLAGARGRVDGIRAADLRSAYPAQVLATAPSSSLGATLRRRLARRRRTKSALAGN
jgi:N-acetylglucosaminyl-diphospho-decaprenol L-rhamnosyltransferase